MSWLQQWDCGNLDFWLEQREAFDWHLGEGQTRAMELLLNPWGLGLSPGHSDQTGLNWRIPSGPSAGERTVCLEGEILPHLAVVPSVLCVKRLVGEMGFIFPLPLLMP